MNSDETETTRPKESPEIPSTKASLRKAFNMLLAILLSTLTIIFFLFVGLLAAFAIGPHSSCDKFGCSPTSAAFILWLGGSLLISIPLAIKIVDSIKK